MKVAISLVETKVFTKEEFATEILAKLTTKAMRSFYENILTIRFVLIAVGVKLRAIGID